ncbi:hypothetical protein DAPPUDRAFT_322704 [Daphnia pulex]|uniref:Uncharacterized protein n=1 Tax=Daphnia pulex TaxID=6669 RepID=E9GWS1_DAPPU|nr:hypothetical protein DAPPUDRAFT_322704 [Daphnia pulex]|eukprot:EFX76066.1 hypothetical protein DAPPUDRAFT_322704 [Daphnia pulex]
MDPKVDSSTLINVSSQDMSKIQTMTVIRMAKLDHSAGGPPLSLTILFPHNSHNSCEKKQDRLSYSASYGYFQCWNASVFAQLALIKRMQNEGIV